MLKMFAVRDKVKVINEIINNFKEQSVIGNLPIQVLPVKVSICKPLSQLHWKEPGKFWHSCSQPPLLRAHSSIS